jgi:RNA polymerase sigma-70 factor (ECF subfamily)
MSSADSGAHRPTPAPDARDQDLLARIEAGDRAAFEELYRAYYPRLFGYAWRMTRRRELVEEVVDDVLLEVWRSAARFDGRSRVSTWIFGIAYRKTLKGLSRLRPTAPPSEIPVEDPGRDPEQRASDRETSETLEAALRELSSDHRAVVELTYYHGLSYPEIAAIVDCPVNTVKTRMFHARRKLRRLLEHWGWSSGDVV